MKINHWTRSISLTQGITVSEVDGIMGLHGLHSNQANTWNKHHFIKRAWCPEFHKSSKITTDLSSSQSLLLEYKHHLKRSNFDLDIGFYLRIMIKKTATKFISDSSHILHGCYKTKQFYYQIPRADNSRFLNSFIPFVIHTLNN